MLAKSNLTDKKTHVNKMSNIKPRKSLVSLIVPCYNQSEFISETLDSILYQTYNYWECIIINDGSTDNSEEIILEYCKRDSRFKYIYQENQGIVASRNNAIKQCHGRYILPLDGDDIILKEYLELAVKKLDEDDNIELVYCDVVFFGIPQEQRLQLPELNMRNMLFKGCCVNSSVFRKASFDKIGGYKSEMKDGWEDWEFFISLLENGGKAYKLHRTLFKYRVNKNSRTTSINNNNKIKLKTQIVKLHPRLFFEQYDRLWLDYYCIINSRSYKIILFLKKIYKYLTNK